GEGETVAAVFPTRPTAEPQSRGLLKSLPKPAAVPWDGIHRGYRRTSPANDSKNPATDYDCATVKTDEPIGNGPWWHRAGPALAAAGLALLLYAVTLGGNFVYDDIAIVQLDARGSSPRMWGQYWTKDYFNGGLDNL